MLPAGRTFETRVRVAYADTDRMGVVYHANYLVWFERGRTEAMRELGLPYLALEEHGVLLPVVEAGVRFLRPARYDDLLVVETTVVALGRARLRFRYRVQPAEGREAPVLAEGFTEHGFVSRAGRPVRIPDDIYALIEPVVAPGGSTRRRRAAAGWR